MQKNLLLFFLLAAPFTHAQSISYNQYNAVMAETNPAFIVQIEKDYVGLIGRAQWPGYQSGAVMGTFSFNKSFRNSGLGITVHQLQYRDNALNRQRLGLQYATSLIVLDDYFLDLGLNLSLQQEQIKTPVFYDDFSPKRAANTFPVEKWKAQSLRSDLGLVFHPFRVYTKWYLGFSVRNLFLQKLPGENTLDQQPVYSIQAMHNLPVTRRMNLYTYFSAEQHGKKYSSDQTLVKPFTALVFQANLAYKDKISFGAGYKYFTGRYGSLGYRINYTTDRFKKASKYSDKPYHRLTIGLGYEVKPYIQYDRIHTFSSYELFLKYRINYKN